MTHVLLAEHDAPLGDSVLGVLGKVAVLGEWVRSAAELKGWVAVRRSHAPELVLLDWELPGAATGEPLDVVQGSFPLARIVVLSERLSGDGAALLLGQGIPSLQKPINPFILAMLALGLASSRPGRDESSWCRSVMPLGCAARPSLSFDEIVSGYARSRKLSKQQELILNHYLNGESDKEIAERCACSGATVYEHWRRMAKKSGGSQKSCVVTDFHRYLRQAQGSASAWVELPRKAPSSSVG
jgi:DNA-binding NarL/FixJ family response regulator